MTTYTTKKAAKLVRRELYDRRRQLTLILLENESGTVQLEMLSDELDDYERLTQQPVAADIIPNEEISKLLEHLKSEELLEAASGW